MFIYYIFCTMILIQLDLSIHENVQLYSNLEN